MSVYLRTIQYVLVLAIIITFNPKIVTFNPKIVFSESLPNQQNYRLFPHMAGQRDMLVIIHRLKRLMVAFQLLPGQPIYNLHRLVIWVCHFQI